jgi:hypothetical protein
VLAAGAGGSISIQGDLIAGDKYLEGAPAASQPTGQAAGGQITLQAQSVSVGGGTIAGGQTRVEPAPLPVGPGPWPAASALWRDPPIPRLHKMLGAIAILILFALMLWSALVFSVTVLGGALAASAPANVAALAWQLVLPAAGIVFGLYGWQNVRRYAFGYDDFRPRLKVPGHELGQPLEVEMSKPIHGRGWLRFTGGGLDLRAENATVIHLGPGLAADLILTAVTHLLFKRRVQFSLAYAQIMEARVIGRTLTFVAEQGGLKTVQLRVSTADGERLYRELKAHLPAALAEWAHLLM